MKKDSATAMATMPREQRNRLVKKTGQRWDSKEGMSLGGRWEKVDGVCGRSVSATLGVEAVEE